MYQSNLKWDVFIPITYPGIEQGRYVISNTGMIKDIIDNYMVDTEIDNYGFIVVSLLSDKSDPITIRVHRLVAWEFCSKNRAFSNGVGHIDSDKHNNYYKNLAWIVPAKEKPKPKDTLTSHIISTFKKIPGFYHGNPDAFVQYIQSKHPDNKVTKEMVKKILKPLIFAKK